MTHVLMMLAASTVPALVPGLHCDGSKAKYSQEGVLISFEANFHGEGLLLYLTVRKSDEHYFLHARMRAQGELRMTEKEYPVTEDRLTGEEFAEFLKAFLFAQNFDPADLVSPRDSVKP